MKSSVMSSPRRRSRTTSCTALVTARVRPTSITISRSAGRRGDRRGREAPPAARPIGSRSRPPPRAGPTGSASGGDGLREVEDAARNRQQEQADRIGAIAAGQHDRADDREGAAGEQQEAQDVERGTRRLPAASVQPA